MNRFLTQIGKAARLIDIKGDVKNALAVLESVLEDPEIDHYPAEKVEVIVFLADLHMYMHEYKKTEEYLNQIKCINLGEVGPDMVGPHLKRAHELRSILEGK